MIDIVEHLDAGGSLRKEEYVVNRDGWHRRVAAPPGLVGTAQGRGTPAISRESATSLKVQCLEGLGLQAS